MVLIPPIRLFNIWYPDKLYSAGIWEADWSHPLIYARFFPGKNQDQRSICMKLDRRG